MEGVEAADLELRRVKQVQETVTLGFVARVARLDEKFGLETKRRFHS